MEKLVWIGLIAALAVLDLGIKELIEGREDKDFPMELPNSRGKILLRKSHNAGFPFGFLKEKPELVKMVPIAAASAVLGALVYLMGKKGHLLEKLALSLALGGAASNIIDREKRGYVVDYFSFNVKGLKKVVFNLGDMFVLLGSLLVIVAQGLDSLRSSGMARTSARPKADGK